MIITVKLFAGLEKHLNDITVGHQADLDIAVGTTVGQVVNLLKIPEEEAKILLVNASHAKLGQVLQEGDLLVIFPPVGGG